MRALIAVTPGHGATTEMPERMRKRTIRTFRIGRILADTPDPEPCPICDVAMHKALIPFRYYGANTTYQNGRVPGYQCRRCGAETFDQRTFLESLTAIVELFDADEPQSRRQAICRDIKAMRAEIMEGAMAVNAR